MSERMPLAKAVGATEVRNNLGNLLNRVHKGEEQLVVEKLGIPVAAIISIRDYEEYRRLLAQDYHRQLGRRIGAAVESRNLSEEQIIDALDEDREAIYKELYG